MISGLNIILIFLVVRVILFKMGDLTITRTLHLELRPYEVSRHRKPNLHRVQHRKIHPGDSIVSFYSSVNRGCVVSCGPIFFSLLSCTAVAVFSAPQACLADLEHLS